MRETGKVTGALMKALRHAEILAPCATGAKRSREMDEVDELIRAVGLADEDELVEDEDDEEPAPALSRCCPSEHTFDREWPLDDIVIRAGGDGRTVEAYAAVFNQPVEIKDQHGHYMETIDRAAFNEVLAGGIGSIGCFYHHGMTLHGTPSDLGSVPIGSPIDIRTDGHGLRTVTRVNKSALADSVLEAIRAGDLRGYSFRGAIRKSNPPRVARARSGQPLPTVTRMSLGLNEYGPTPTPYYADARILAVRSVQQIASDPVALRELQRELARMLSRSTPLDQEQESATPDEEGPGAEDQHPVHSGRHQADIARKIARARILMGVGQ
jgi:HK97 family phage prohead protease